jgi:hypothetical protein
MLTEFGGIAVAGRSGEWGYARAQDAAQFARKYRALLAHVRSSELLAGFCYTQLADTYQEATGLLHADRTPKIPLAQIAAATSGAEGASPEPVAIPDEVEQPGASRHTGPGTGGLDSATAETAED